MSDAPEYVKIALANPGDEWGRLWVAGRTRTAAPPAEWEWVEYRRADLAGLPGDRAIELKEALWRVEQDERVGTVSLLKLVAKDILAWHESQGAK